jgi:DNA-binding IclR family transcriptional regulator
MQAIELLAFQPATATQIAEALGVHPGTSRRLLNRLVADGWLSTSGGHRKVYAPTLRIVALAANLAERDPLGMLARPIVTRLHEGTGLAAHLSRPSYRSALCLVHRAGGPDARPQLRELVPAHAAAAGKVLLAHRDPWRASVLSAPLDAITPRTITEPAAVEREALLTRERGYAVEDGELDIGVRGVAVPVRAPDGGVFASLALSGAGSELELDAFEERARSLRAGADDLERALAAGGPS